MFKQFLAVLLASLWLAAPAAAGNGLKIGDAIPDQYIVVLKDDAGRRAGLLGALPRSAVTDLAGELIGRYGGDTLYVFGPALNGFLARLTPAQAERLARDPAVRHVEPDRVVGTRNAAATTWGLDRVDQRALPLDGRFGPPGAGGQGVHVYVIDTGLRASHNEFRGRVGGGANFAGRGPGPGLLDSILELVNPGQADREDWEDCNGHGTHVGGSAAGARYGVAPRATVYGVRVLGCDGSGTNSGVIAGVDWVLEEHKKPAVANFSLGGGNSDALDQAVRRLIDAGVTTVVAAGNDDADACSGSPNRVREAITVGATDRSDRRAGFSNWGGCVDIFAPGHEIQSAWYQSDNQTQTISGTSMAAPHVAGAAALVLGAIADAKPDQVARLLKDGATTDKLSNLRGGSPNRLLFLTVPDSAADEEAQPEQQKTEPRRGLRRLLPF